MAIQRRASYKAKGLEKADSEDEEEKEMMCPNCGTTGSNIDYEIKMIDRQFWECKTCGQEWVIRVPKEKTTKYKIKEEEKTGEANKGTATKVNNG